MAVVKHHAIGEWCNQKFQQLEEILCLGQQRDVQTWQILALIKGTLQAVHICHLPAVVKFHFHLNSVHSHSAVVHSVAVF